MAMNMLSAYYSSGQNTRSLFEDLNISGEAGIDRHLNRYNVLKINMQSFVSMTGSIDEMLKFLSREVLEELKQESGIVKTKISLAMMDTYYRTGKQFVILIDEWDCLFRERI